MNGLYPGGAGGYENYVPLPRVVTNRNNGVIALVTEEVMIELEMLRELAATKRGKLLMQAGPPVPGPIFTFADGHEYEEFVTGNMKLFSELRNFFDKPWSWNEDSRLYIPFSSGYQHSKDDHKRKVELTYRTTKAEFAAAFPGFTAPRRPH